jgi:hypothetical protein
VPFVSEQEYLTSVCEPDCESDEGRLLERNAGERPHSILQGEFIVYLHGLGKRHGLRVNVAPRIPPWKCRSWSFSAPSMNSRRAL